MNGRLFRPSSYFRDFWVHSWVHPSAPEARPLAKVWRRADVGGWGPPIVPTYLRWHKDVPRTGWRGNLTLQATQLMGRRLISRIGRRNPVSDQPMAQ